MLVDVRAGGECGVFSLRVLSKVVAVELVDVSVGSEC